MEDLIARVLSSEATPAEVEALEAWRRATPDNERAFQEFARAWQLTAPRHVEPVPPPPPVSAIVDRAERRRRDAVPLVPRGRSRRRWRWIAAAAVLMAAAGTLARALRPTPSHVIATGPGEFRTVTLADGSIVRLGPVTRLRITDAAERTMTLRGLAFFAVAHDSTHPFIVRVGGASARALGTRFELRAGGDSLRLVVVEGRVALSAHGQQVVARVGEESHVRRSAGPSAPRKTDRSALDAWPHGVLIFQATPLGQALREVAAQFGRPVLVHDTTVAARAVTAWFENEPVAEVVATVCRVAGARCVVGDTIALVQ